MHRDSYASFVGLPSLIGYMALAENESIGRERYTCLQRMLQPCGLPPAKAEDEDDEEAAAVVPAGK